VELLVLVLNIGMWLNTVNSLSWRRSIVVRTLVSAGKLSLSCSRLLAGCG